MGGKRQAVGASFLSSNTEAQGYANTGLRLGQACSRGVILPPSLGDKNGFLGVKKLRY